MQIRSCSSRLHKYRVAKNLLGLSKCKTQICLIQVGWLVAYWQQAGGLWFLYSWIKLLERGFGDQQS
jgi:hypothetical protein